MKLINSVKQQGFTLIELVIVMVLLGILGVVATARFQDLAGTANANALEAVAAEVQSASAINYAVAATGGTPSQVVSSTTNACTTIMNGLLTNGALPGDYTTTGNVAPACGAQGDVVVCTITQTPTGSTQDINLLCTAG